MTITDYGGSDSTAIDAPIAGRREWIGLMVLGLANLQYVMDLTVLSHWNLDRRPLGRRRDRAGARRAAAGAVLVGLGVPGRPSGDGPAAGAGAKDAARGTELRGGRPDLPSATMPVVALLATIYGLKQVVRDGLDLLPAGCIVVGLAVGPAMAAVVAVGWPSWRSSRWVATRPPRLTRMKAEVARATTTPCGQLEAATR